VNDIDLDLDRKFRIGMPEIVYGEGKSVEQIREIARRHAERGENMLVTRCTADKVVGLDGEFDPVSRTFVMLQKPIEVRDGPVGIVYAGSSDAPVAREAAVTLGFLGCRSVEFGDCGVAALHRLTSRLDAIGACRAIICCAGFEGALPSVVGGLISLPIIAVPTSVGYGVSRDGHIALHAMLASCASGIVVMNIDNGCGAAMAARRILGPIRT